MAVRDTEYYDDYLDPDTWPEFMRAGLIPAPPSGQGDMWPDAAATDAPVNANAGMPVGLMWPTMPRPPQQAPDPSALFMQSGMMPAPTARAPMLAPDAGTMDAPSPVDEASQAQAARLAAAMRLGQWQRRGTQEYGPPDPGPLLPVPPMPYTESANYWGAGPTSAAPYLSPVPPAPNWDQVVPGPTPWSPLAPPPKPTQWGDVLTGIECTRSADGNSATCITPGGRQATVPAEGFPEYIGPGERNYHYYNKPVGGTRADPTQLMQAVINEPTPGPGGGMVSPATPEGPMNEATPPSLYYPWLFLSKERFGASLNPVKSYLTTDQYGAPMMVNVTLPEHNLAPGVVMRYVTTGPSGSTIQNEGTGLGLLQNPASPLANPINNVWLDQSRGFIAEQEKNERRSRR